MAWDVDWRAAEQLERLFHTRECTVWEVVDRPDTASPTALPIHRADGAVVAYARPAPLAAPGAAMAEGVARRVPAWLRAWGWRPRLWDHWQAFRSL